MFTLAELCHLIVIMWALISRFQWERIIFIIYIAFIEEALFFYDTVLCWNILKNYVFYKFSLFQFNACYCKFLWYRCKRKIIDERAATGCKNEEFSIFFIREFPLINSFFFYFKGISRKHKTHLIFKFRFHFQFLKLLSVSPSTCNRMWKWRKKR